MTTEPFDDDPVAEAPTEHVSAGRPRRRTKRDPAAVLNAAMVVYIFVMLLFALPLVIFPQTFFDLIGLEARVADALGGLRWFGATLLAWAISGILVLARPGGRAIFVTTGALQLTLGALSFLYSWSVSEYEWSSWYHVIATLVLGASAAYLWWARVAARRVLASESPPSGG
jgi:hypothetical protein